MDCFGLFKTIIKADIESEGSIAETETKSSSEGKIIIPPNINPLSILRLKIAYSSNKKESREPVSNEAISSILTFCYYDIQDGKYSSPNDREVAEKEGMSLLFGEITIKGVNKVFEVEHLNGKDAKIIYDLGMGLGKLAIQAFYQFPNVSKVVGVEFARSRFERAIAALRKLPELDINSDLIFQFSSTHIEEFELRSSFNNAHLNKDNRKYIEFRNESLFDTLGLETADIIIMQTNFYEVHYEELIELLSKFKIGCRLLSYKNLAHIFYEKRVDFPFSQLRNNITHEDTFETRNKSAGVQPIIFIAI